MKVFVNSKSGLGILPNNLDVVEPIFEENISWGTYKKEAFKVIKNYVEDTETPSVLLVLSIEEWANLGELMRSDDFQLYSELNQNAEALWLNEVKNFIRERIEASDLSSTEICKHFGLSRSSLYRRLKKQTNKSVTEFIREVRLEVALEYLKMKAFSISEIAYKTGFSSPSHFTRVFKKTYDKTPSSALSSFSAP
jgi:AraC-like DNA-binding protein